MAGNSYSVQRKELKRLLVAYRVSEPDIARLFSDAEKKHNHINVISFYAELQRLNISRDKIIQILRRFGMDDLAISKVMDMADAEKLLSESGHLYRAKLIM
ncbi:MAG: hypothetical protein M1562_01310 [Candidatus Marsarchaeota archaeon]|jgi:hypothetical protein|nr:hypothetical protein [Candidatus Marsarchaeota archaeon]